VIRLSDLASRRLHATIRYIERNGARYVVIPAETYDRMIDDLDDLDDIRAYDRANAEPQEFYPVEIVDHLIVGEDPVKVFREYRGFTQGRPPRLDRHLEGYRRCT
jgi:hypothetical protein